MKIAEYNAMIVEAGRNGLTCSIYLAKAGLKVLVVERRYLERHWGPLLEA